MAKPQATGVKFDQAAGIGHGQPTGNFVFLPIPEVVYAAFSDEAAKRGMTLAQLFARALGDFLKSTNKE